MIGAKVPVCVRRRRHWHNKRTISIMAIRLIATIPSWNFHVHNCNVEFNFRKIGASVRNLIHGTSALGFRYDPLNSRRRVSL